AMRACSKVMAGIVAAVSALVAMAVPSGAATLSSPIADGLAGPLQLAVGNDGTVYVGQSFSGVLTAIGRRGTTDIASAAPGGEIAGVDALGPGTVTHTSTVFNGDTTVAATVDRVLPNGRTTGLDDTVAYEQASHPDQAH